MSISTQQALVTDIYENITSSMEVTTLVYPQEYHRLNAVINFLNRYYIWVIFAFGCPGNVMSICVIAGMSRRRLTTSFFSVAVLAVVDNLTIIMKMVENQSRSHKMLSFDETGCQFLFFLGLTCAAFANWILIIISAERFTAVAFPMKVALIWSLRRAVGIIVCVFVFLGLVHSHIFASVTHYENYTCTVKTRFHQYIHPYWYFTSATVYAFIPATCLIVFNVLIIVLLRRSSATRRHMLSESDASNVEARRQDRQVTIMLVTVAVTFLILTIPRCVCVIAYHSMCTGNADLMCTTRRQLFDTLTTQIADTNHAINFYLYVLTGRRFRENFLKLFKCRQMLYMKVSSSNTHMSELPLTESRI
ncbi:sex peptide receptor-related protein 2-like [Haliotis rufescens]|uniref:sex peptide receptor-related protein 2-like n=1 Tax=Haliotis rufescens TaxID=6454 RepID=UPI00201E775F|nr:sex peptide receptor-related protein 2-like [Haliotis rufescens]